MSNPVQIWDIFTGGACSNDWYVSAAGHVSASATFPFKCGDGLNVKYNGDPVFKVVYAPGSINYVPFSTGYSAPVELTELEPGVFDGYWVAADNNTTDTRLIDPETTCRNYGVEEYVYAGCDSNGCLVREERYPTSNWYWVWRDVNVG